VFVADRERRRVGVGVIVGHHSSPTSLINRQPAPKRCGVLLGAEQVPDFQFQNRKMRRPFHIARVFLTPLLTGLSLNLTTNLQHAARYPVNSGGVTHLPLGVSTPLWSFRA